jgi:hypothetical protein
LALLYYFQYINFERRGYKDPIFFLGMEFLPPKSSIPKWKNLGNKGENTSIFKEKNNAEIQIKA